MSMLAQGSVASDLRASVETVIRMETDISFEQCPGFIVGIIDNTASYAFSFGTASPWSTDTLTVTDVFELGSVTKPMVATLVALLAESGELSLERPVNQLIPEAYRNQSLDDLTLRDLLIHRSGLPRYPTMFGDHQKNPRDPYASFSKDQLLTFFRDYKVTERDFMYSHVNYALIEVILEEQLGIPFERLMKENLLCPLGMDSSGVYEHGGLTAGFDLGGKLVTPWTFQAFAGSEGARSSADDMLKFLRFSLASPPPGVLKNYSETTLDKSIHMALGWYIVEQRKSPDIYAHSGYTSGHYCFAGIVPDTQTGVVILANSSTGVEDLGFEILRLINFNWKRKSNG